MLTGRKKKKKEIKKGNIPSHRGHSLSDNINFAAKKGSVNDRSALLLYIVAKKG